MKTPRDIRELWRDTKAPAFIIGEVAQSHEGSLGQAHAYIDAIADAGADAVKFQTHIAAEESSPDEPWRVKFSTQDASRYDYWKRMEFTPEQWAELKEHADKRGLTFLSSPFSLAAVRLLDSLGMTAWKIASGEVGNFLLLDAIRATGKPVLLSSGMSGWQELDKAVHFLKEKQTALAVMQCTTAYPCPPEKAGLNLLQEFKTRYACPTGLSDHSGTIYPSLASITLGAKLIEVHVTMSRQMFGPDVPASLTCEEFSELVEGTRFIETALLNPVNKDKAAEGLSPLREIFGQSITAARDLTAGSVIALQDLGSRKPGNGLPVSSALELKGRKLSKYVTAGSLLKWSDFE
jgi:N-acetylneuraminate synthase